MSLMRYLPGTPTEIAGESITSHSLIRAAVAEPDVLPRVWQAYGARTSPLSGLLSEKDMVTRGLFDNFSSSRYRVVGSNHVMYKIKNADRRKVYMIANKDGLTYKCDAYPTEPGKNKTPVTIWLSNNWARPKELIELNDNDTLAYVHDTHEPYEEDGGFRYSVVLWSKTREDYFNTALFEEGAECGVVMAPYEQDFSETGAEKYTFHGWGHAYMTLQRVKMSFSGTAEAMTTGKTWLSYQNSGGQKVSTYIDYADNEMMQRIADYHEYATILGKGTVSVDGDVMIKDIRGREILAGDGVLNQGDGAYERPMNGEWTFKHMEKIMMDLDIQEGRDGKLNVAMIAGKQSRLSFTNMMIDKGFVTQDNNLEGSGENKGLVNTYKFYEVDNVRINVLPWKWLDDPTGRPSKWLSDGTRKGSWDSYFVPIGSTAGGDNSVELIQLRPMKKGTVSGINKGGEMATSVDGEHTHVLVQSGVISRGKVMKAFRSYSS